MGRAGGARSLAAFKTRYRAGLVVGIRGVCVLCIGVCRWGLIKAHSTGTYPKMVFLKIYLKSCQADPAKNPMVDSFCHIALLNVINFLPAHLEISISHMQVKNSGGNDQSTFIKSCQALLSVLYVKVSYKTVLLIVIMFFTVLTKTFLVLYV